MTKYRCTIEESALSNGKLDFAALAMVAYVRQVSKVLTDRGRRASHYVRTLASVLALCALSAVAAQSQQSFTVTIALTASPSTGVHAGDVVTLTAAVLVNGTPCSFCGPEIQFLDTSVQPQLIGKAMFFYTIEGNTQSSVKVRFGAGTHSIKALLLNNVYATGTISSAATVLTVAPPTTPFSTVTSVTASGTPGNYTLSGTTVGKGSGTPTGNISFTDTSNSGNVLATGSLGAFSGSFASATLPGAVTNNPNGIAIGDFNNDGYSDVAIVNSGDDTVSVYLNNGAGGFGSANTFQTSHHPVAIAAGDLRGRGITDLVVVSTSPSQMEWYAGNGNGTFTDTSGHALNNTPSQVVLGCVPTLWDQAVCPISQSAGMIEAYIVQTTNTFTTYASLNGVYGNLYATQTPTALVTADFNNDGILDMAWGNVSSKVTVLYTNNQGQTTSALYPVGAPPVAMVVGDFNNDGYPDLAVVTNPSGLYIAMNRGDGTFNTPTWAFNLSNPGQIVTGDFNGDGKLDLAIQQTGAAPISIFYGNGAGGFFAAPISTVNSGYTTFNGSLGIADLDGDGLPDLIATPNQLTTKSFSVILARQNRTGTASAATAYGTGAHNANAVYAGDSAFAASSSTGLTETIYAPSGPVPTITMTVVESAAHGRSALKSSLKPALEIAENTPITIAAVVSADGVPVTQGTVTFLDGTVILGSQALSSTGTASTITVLGPGSHQLSSTYNGSGSVSAGASLSTIVMMTPTISSALADSGAPGNYVLTSVITGDAFDIPTGAGTFVDGTTSTTLGHATVTPGNIKLQTIAAPGSPTNIAGTPISVAAGDFDGDHNADLAVIDSAASTVSILMGNGTGQMTIATGSPIALSAAPVRITTADFNGDSKNDLAIATTSGKVIILLNDGSGQFHVASTITANSDAAIVSGDFNGDGETDLAVADNTGSGTLTILLGDGTGTFTLASGSPFVVPSPSSIVTGDFNHDGTLDLAVANSSANTISVLLGNGNGSFASAAHSPFATGTNPIAIAAGDFNGDGKLDLAAANQTSSNLTILLGDGAGNFTAASNSPLALSAAPAALSAGAVAGKRSGLAVANQNGTITVLQSDSVGNFSEVAGSPVPVSTSLTSMVLADFDNDGKPDFAALDTNSLGIKLNRATSSSTIVVTNIAVAGSGPQSVTANYSGDSVYPASVSNAVTLTSTTVPDFTIASTTSSQSIAPGKSANYTISVTPQNAFTGTVDLSCSGLPARYTCAFVPAALTLTTTKATTVMTISATQSATSMPRNGPFKLTGLSSTFPSPQSAVWLFSGAALFLLVVTRKGSAGRFASRMACATVMFAAIGLLPGCGSSPGFASPPPTYTVTVIGTSGTLRHSTTVTLVVKDGE